MSHPEPTYDFESEREDDDLLRQECDARRLEDEQTTRAEMRKEYERWERSPEAQKEYLDWLDNRRTKCP